MRENDRHVREVHGDIVHVHRIPVYFNRTPPPPGIPVPMPECPGEKSLAPSRH